MSNNITRFADYEKETEIPFTDKEIEAASGTSEYFDDADEELDWDALRETEADEGWQNLRDALNDPCCTF